MDEELIYQYATTEDEQEAYELLLLLILFFMTMYEDERKAFAERNSVDLTGMDDSEVTNEYTLYITDLLIGMRERTLKAKQELSVLSRAAFLVAMQQVVKNNWNTLHDSEVGNAKQTAQLEVATLAQMLNRNIQIFKRWVAHPDCCKICAALDGVQIPIDEPFLVPGQSIDLADGSEFVYEYIERGIATAHPNDRCHVEFIIEF